MTGTDTFFTNMQQSMIVEARRKVAGEIRKLKAENSKLKKTIIPQNKIKKKENELKKWEEKLKKKEEDLSKREKTYELSIRKKFKSLFEKCISEYKKIQNLKKKNLGYLLSDNYNSYHANRRRQQDISALQQLLGKIK